MFFCIDKIYFHVNKEIFQTSQIQVMMISQVPKVLEPNIFNDFFTKTPKIPLYIQSIIFNQKEFNLDVQLYHV